MSPKKGPGSSRFESLTTILEIMRELSRVQWRMVDLAERTGVPLRALYRHMHAIRMAGIPIERDGYYYSIDPEVLRRYFLLGSSRRRTVFG